MIITNLKLHIKYADSIKEVLLQNIKEVYYFMEKPNIESFEERNKFFKWTDTYQLDFESPNGECFSIRTADVLSLETLPEG